MQSEDLDLLTIPNYKVDRVVDSFVLESGQPVFLIFIKTTEENRGYLSLSFCNPETGSACSFRGKDGKFVFILAHGYEDKDQFVRDMETIAEWMKQAIDNRDDEEKLNLLSKEVKKFALQYPLPSDK